MRFITVPQAQNGLLIANVFSANVYESETGVDIEQCLDAEDFGSDGRLCSDAGGVCSEACSLCSFFQRRAEDGQVRDSRSCQPWPEGSGGPTVDFGLSCMGRRHLRWCSGVGVEMKVEQ